MGGIYVDKAGTTLKPQLHKCARRLDDDDLVLFEAAFFLSPPSFHKFVFGTAAALVETVVVVEVLVVIVVARAGEVDEVALGAAFFLRSDRRISSHISF